jgi:hypothetical protein
MFSADASAAATPMTRLAVEMIPSLAPSTAARSQPTRPEKCLSAWCLTASYPPGLPMKRGAAFRNTFDLVSFTEQPA